MKWVVAGRGLLKTQLSQGGSSLLCGRVLLLVSTLWWVELGLEPEVGLAMFGGMSRDSCGFLRKSLGNLSPDGGAVPQLFEQLGLRHLSTGACLLLNGLGIKEIIWSVPAADCLVFMSPG